LGLVAVVTLVAAALFGRLPAHRPPERREERLPAPGLLPSIRQALRYLWQHGTLRTLFLVVSAINLFTVGPLYVGLPLLAGTRLAGGAAALGLLTSALGGGALLGTALAGVLPQPAPRRLGLALLLTLGLCGGGLAVLRFTSSTVAGALLVLGIGAAVNYANVTLVTWVQRHTPPAMMGRLMSLVALK
jgi:predicted MFS family arabinose efflux permease